MPISELQAGLIAAGAAAVVGVFAFNKWQERKHRKQAEQVFRSDHPDVLLEPGAKPARGAPAAEERIEPVLADMPADVELEPAPAAPLELPDVPFDLADPRADWVVRLETGQPVASHNLWEAQEEAFELVQKGIHWYALDPRGEWIRLTRHTAGEYQRFRCALQLADRRGPLSSAELSTFLDGLQALGDRFMAVVDFPLRGDVAEAGAKLDAFCARVDVQIGVNVIAAEQPFAGSRVRAVAEALGFSLRGDGQFHGEDEAGRTLFTLGNLEAALFAADEMARLQTRGLILILDVPRVDNGPVVFDYMVAAAKKLAEGLGGTLVDDNRAPLSDPKLALIRGQIAQFQQEMAAYGIPAGSETALRLFD